MLLLILTACEPQPSTKDTVDSGTPDSADSGDTSDTGETGETDDTGDTGDTGGGGSTTGPDLPDCTAATGTGTTVALSGVVLTPEGAVAGLVVYDTSTGLITCVGETCDTTGATVVCTEGVISPGLIDPHNHLNYNTLPVWDVGPEFEDRYEWQDDSRYDDFKEAYNAIKDDYVCEIGQWADAREVIYGATSAVGASGGSCLAGLIRNLDESSSASGFDDYDLTYGSSDVTDAVEAEDVSNWQSDLASGASQGIIEHVAEGKNGSVNDEIDYMIELGAEGPGFAYVHATDATTEQLALMAAAGTGLIWSPRSNLALYGTTTPIEIADALGVPWAIGTDWTPSGSMGPVRELSCAFAWLSSKGKPLTDEELWRKSTEDAARIVGLDGVVGQLVPGMVADISVFNWKEMPYLAVIEAMPATVRLVIVDGEPVYGLEDLMTDLGATDCEALDVCSSARTICMPEDSVVDLEATLTAAMASTTMASGYEYAAELMPLWECDDLRDSCDISTPTTGDTDGDGIADGDDVCPYVYDPNQWDTDEDGFGDSCDVCPMVSGEDCELATEDVDGDGFGNEVDNCPYDANPDQADADGDGHGDACDDCVDEPNPGSEGCPTTTTALHDGTKVDGDAVRVDDLIVTAVGEFGFAAQDAAAGIYVYDNGANVVVEGDVVTVNGTLTDYYGWAEITDPTVSVTSTSAVPEPIDLDACDLGGGLESYESMLVRINGVTVTNENPDGPDEDYDEMEINSCFRIDDYFYDALDQSPVDTTWGTVTGIYFYSFDNYKIGPRRDTDLD